MIATNSKAIPLNWKFSDMVNLLSKHAQFAKPQKALSQFAQEPRLPIFA